MQAGRDGVTILGVFMADTSFRADRLPRLGETFPGKRFALGPGGKGSNQAVAAARLGTTTRFITTLGDDAFAELAERTWREAGVTPIVRRDPSVATGAAFIFIEDASGDNAIIICPGAAGTIAPTDVDAAGDAIRAAAVFVTQLEQPLDAARRGLELAREAAVTTVLNPAPALALDDAVLALADYVTPNAGEAEALTGIAVASLDDARRAGDALLGRGARACVLTLGADGALLHTAERSAHVPAVNAGPVVETTGAGDAFNAGFAAALARGEDALEAVKLGACVAGLAVTRAGTAVAMPTGEEVGALRASLP